MRTYWTPGLARYLLRHPSGIAPVARAGWQLRRVGWWRRPPFLPLPAPSYWEFRLTTVAGASKKIDPREVVAAAKWSVRQRVGE